MSPTTWTGPSGGNWSTPANWNGGRPGLGVDAEIYGLVTAPVTVVVSTGSNTANSLTTMLNGQATASTVQVTGGSLTLNYASSLTSTGTAVVQKGGLIDFQNGEGLNQSSTITGNGAAVLQSAGTLQVDQGGLALYGNSSFAGTVTGAGGGGTIIFGTTQGATGPNGSGKRIRL